MLILSRRVDQAVLLGDDVRVVVLSCDGETVKLGIEAPPHVSILREEIVQEVADENRRARAPEAAREWLGAIEAFEGPVRSGPEAPAESD